MNSEPSRHFAFCFFPITVQTPVHLQSSSQFTNYASISLFRHRNKFVRTRLNRVEERENKVTKIYSSLKIDSKEEKEAVTGFKVTEKQVQLDGTHIDPAFGNLGVQRAKDAARVTQEHTFLDSDPPKPLIYQKKLLTFPELIWDRTKDSVTDAKMHLKRKYFPRLSDPVIQKPRILVLGAGWAAHALIKVIDNEKFDVVCLSPRNYFLFTPMLASTTVGTLEFRSVVEPIRRANEHIDYLEASCVDVDHERRIAYCRGPEKDEIFQVPYTFLVTSVGAVTNTFGTPGVKEHCYFLKEINDARNLRRGIVDCFELANLPGTSEEEQKRLLHFVVIGGGPSGCEFTAELNDFLQRDLSKYYPKLIGKVQTTLLQSADALLLQFDKSLQQRAMENFKKTGIEVITGARVVNVTENTIMLKDGREIDYGLALWAAGNGTSPLVSKLIEKVPEQKNARGRLLVDDWMRVKGMDGVFAVGDCSEIESGPLPATAQVAGQQGAYLGRLLNQDYCLSCELPSKNTKDKNIDSTGKNVLAKPFQFLSLGILTYIGNERALAQIDAGKSHLNLAGHLTYILWRSVYLTKQVSMRNRFLVLFDWARTQMFGRDISLF